MKVYQKDDCIFLEAEFAQLEPDKETSHIFRKQISSKKLFQFQENEFSCLSKIPVKNLRMYSKNTLLAIECMSRMDIENKIKGYDRSRIGIYTSAPVDLPIPPETLEALVAETGPEADIFRQTIPPKYRLKNGVGLMPAHLSIHWGVTGPTNAYYSKDFGLVHALSQAQLDLVANRIDLALVVGVFTVENPLQFLEIKKNLLQNEIVECSFGTFMTIQNAKNFDIILNQSSRDFSHGTYAGGLTGVKNLFMFN